MIKIRERVNQFGARYGKWVVLAGTLVMTGMWSVNPGGLTAPAIWAFALMWVISTVMFTQPFDRSEVLADYE